MQQQKKYSGVIIPMITPFTENGKIDYAAVTRITTFLVEHGTAPFILGTTGESASIPEEYRPAFVENLVSTVSGRIVTYAGISGNCLQTSIEAGKRYYDLGIGAVVAHPPGYYPLNEDQLRKYFEMLVEGIPGSLILYNIPSVTGISIPLSVVEELSLHPQVVALKDSERDLDRLNESIERWSSRDDFSHLIGWAAQSADGLLKGSDGLVPSTGNFVPGMFQELYEATKNGNSERAYQLQDETDEIAEIYQKDKKLSESLAALKVMMSELSLCNEYVLPPLTRLNADVDSQIRKETKELKLKIPELLTD